MTASTAFIGVAGEELVVSAPEHAVRADTLMTPRDIKTDLGDSVIGMADFLVFRAPNDMGLRFLPSLHDAKPIAS